MLVDNKFFYISLPRCASTSFMVTCIVNGIPIQHFDEAVDKKLKTLDKNLTPKELSYAVRHDHESCSHLFRKFGNNYDVISVKRNRYERFISTWEHVIHELEKRSEFKVSNIFRKLNENDLLQYTSDNLTNDVEVTTYANEFIDKNNLILYNDNNREYLVNMLRILLYPTSNWHNHNPNIIWFDFEKLYELEEWVSTKLGKSFKLEKTNSSKHIEVNLKLTDNFIKKYNEIYDIYDFPKSKKTLL